MVTRKPVPSPGSNPPYPIDSTTTPLQRTEDNSHNGLTRSRSSSVSSNNTWNSGFSDNDNDREDGVPDSLRPGAKTGENGALPSSLRVGQQQNPWAQQDTTTTHTTTDAVPAPQIQSHNPHNPYLRAQKTGQSAYASNENSSQSVWGDNTSNPPPSLSNAALPPLPNAAPPPLPNGPPPPLPGAPPPAPPVELPTMRSPVEQHMANLSLHEERAAFASEPGHSLAPAPPGLQPALVPERTGTSMERGPSQASSSNPWQNDLDQQNEDEIAPVTVAPLQVPRQASPPLISLDEAPLQPPPRSPRRPSPASFEAMPSPKPSQSVSPALLDEAPPAKPLRPAGIDVAQSRRNVSTTSIPETPTTKAKRQRNETYQIKHIRWYDASAGSKGSIRTSPILTQNANGPCPLLALVNALALSTPEHIQTALVDALQSREQVSLGLLLDAVFEELARRSDVTGKELPDVGDLYSFLITLHTGMNVNPQFVASAGPQRGSLEVHAVNMDGMHPMYRTNTKPGVFEETREMRLYSTFDIPLIHGWIPPADSQTYRAFDRSARTFDEALNVQFMEEELESKLRDEGLAPEEQQTFEDVTSIKQFLETYPTQLSDYGLQIMNKSLQPGQIAILFRNDHFSTLYKDPRSGTLMTLVTDAGYSSHDEVVWESLVDVSGAAGSLFSGDFRPVGNSAPSGVGAPAGGADDGWETIPSSDNHNESAGRGVFVQESGVVTNTTDPPTGLAAPSEVTRTASEQEDHDLALALQLQEEEEDSHRRDQAVRRQREEEMSRQFLEREADSPSQRPQIPLRRSNLNNRTNDPGAPPTADAPYVRASSGAEDQPPSYEQAASDRPFRPPGSGPRPQQGDPLSALDALERQQQQQQQSAYASQQSLQNPYAGRQSPSMGHRRRSSAMNVGGSRLNRRLSQQQQQQSSPTSPIYDDRMAGPYNANMANGPPGSRPNDRECVVM